MAKKPNGYWTLKRTLEKSEDFVKNGYNLSRSKLKELDEGGLIKAIQKNGGLYKIKELLEIEDKRKPNGFYSKMTKEEWMAYGKEKNYDQLARNKMGKIDRGYYKVGLKRKWINDLIKIQWPGIAKFTEKEWLAYGKENGYDKLTRNELQEGSKSYYEKGLNEGWINELIPYSRVTVTRGFFKNMTKKEWLNYGKKNNLDKLNREKLKDMKARYYNIGIKQGWINELIPSKQMSNIKQALDGMLNEYIQGDAK